MITPEDTPRDPPSPEETPHVDAAVSRWDPWLISMYIDAVRSIESQELQPSH
jgi:hypothetical protein